MTGPSLDLDALREELQRYCVEPWKVPGVISRCLSVLALVEEQRKALTRLRDYGALTDEFVRMTAEAALAGSPAENKDQT